MQKGHRAKNLISPEEPYFTTFYYNGFQYSEVKFNHFFGVLGKKVSKFIGKRRKKSVSVENEEITGDSKFVTKYGHLTKYGSLYGFYSKMPLFINLTLSLQFL